jgi:NADPH:quinone reductase-like Zn-dependent oxidoreductase
MRYPGGMPFIFLKTKKVVPIVDRRYPLSEVTEALRYLEEDHTLGKVVITVEHNKKT